MITQINLLNMCDGPVGVYKPMKWATTQGALKTTQLDPYGPYGSLKYFNNGLIIIIP